MPSQREACTVISCVAGPHPGQWRFIAHFTCLAPRLDAAAASLGRLLPNLGGPDGRVRKLYGWTVLAMALYRAPVWAADIRKNLSVLPILCRVQRKVALRAARAYRTVSHTAAVALAGTSPAELLAQMYADVYRLSGTSTCWLDNRTRHQRSIPP
ncbi:uncharacterized protein [Anoplolepis gracilipes]|uniref:uncharacterized protein n=1 Tax=Anoplolepis gracilipes TaxID=354296 RepID=UPI003BA30358